MKKYVVLGVNNNPIYQYYLPLVFWAWRRFDWEPIVFYSSELDKRMSLIANISGFTMWRTNIKSYGSATVAQVSRLYAALTINRPNDLLMTSDTDMIPLSNYWVPSDLDVTCYGRDLTDYHYPICYAVMTAQKWLDVMMVTDSDYNKCIEEDLNERPKNSNPWLWDQDILTERLNRYGKKFLHLIPRGTDKRTGYPLGRVDRSYWTLDHSRFIDCHAPHDILTNEKSFHNVMQLLHTVWPKEDWKWFINYTKEFKKLL